MKEFSPINQEQLTTQAHASKLEIRGDIFMPGEPGGTEGPTFVSKTEAQRLPNADQLRREWHRVFSQEDLKNADTRSTIEAAIGLGISPATIKGKGPDAPQAKTVIANSTLLSESDRIIKAQGLLGREISSEEQAALLRAHVKGAGVYQNSEAQLLGKARILKEQGFTEKEIRILMEAGLVAASPPGGTPPPEGNSQPEDEGQEFAEGNNANEQRGSSVRLYLEQRDITMLEQNPLKWLDSKFDMIYQFVDEGQELQSPQISQLQQMFTMGANYISTYAKDFNFPPELVKEFSTQFNTRLNIIFLRSAIEHRNMESVNQATERLRAHGLFTALTMEGGQVNSMFSRMSEFLEDKRLAQEKIVDDISKLENNPADDKKRSELLAAAKEFHITPEMMSRLQDDLIKEQLSLAERGVGQYVDIFNTAKTTIQASEGEIRRTFEAQGMSPEQIEQEIKNLIKAEVRKNAEPQIKRSVRTAYDVLVVSQRQGVIVARGHRLPGPVENYLSDPSGLFNVFNHEDLLTDKFNIYNKHAAEFLRELKEGIAVSKLQKLGIDPSSLTSEEREAYGKNAFRDLFAVPDFFSSGWRILGIEKAIKDRLAWEMKQASGETVSNAVVEQRVKEFGLFLQLKDAGRTGGKDVWGKIAEIRPEEIVRLFRERAGGNAALTAKLEEFFNDDAFREFRKGANGEVLDGFKTYDKFKAEFGPLVQILRQQGYDEFKALRLGKDNYGLSEKDPMVAKFNEAIVKYFAKDDLSSAENEVIGGQKADQLKKMFARFTEVAREGFDSVNIVTEKINGIERKFVRGTSGAVIYELMANNKFEDIYTRTILVDDALLDKLESPPAESDLISISKYWTSEVGGDALVRNYKDLANAAQAAGKLLKFIYTEDAKERIKAAEEFADLNSQYAGQFGRAEALRYTVGSLLDMSKQDFIWDAVGISKLPFRKSMSKIEEIYGPQVHPMSRDELRVHVDNIHSMMVAAIDRVNKTPEQIAEKEREAEATYHELEKLLEIDPKNMVKRRAASFLVYMVLAVVAEGVFLSQKVAKGK